MTTVRMVVTEIEPGAKNADGGREITIVGVTYDNQPAHCVLTFGTAADLERLRTALTALDAS